MTEQEAISVSPPADLVHAIGSDCNLLPESGCPRILSLGRSGKGDYTWGYRIYRTTYHRPNSDADFARAIQILNDYIRAECFKYYRGDRILEHVDGDANRQLWQRKKHDIVEDSGLLEGASAAPEKLLKLHQDWVHSHPGAKVPGHSFYRYFLVVDDEVINHLVQLPTPARYHKSIPAAYAVKLFDAWSNISWDLYGREPTPEPESDDDASDDGMLKDEDLEDYNGWLWIGVFDLVSFWFREDNAAVEELCKSDDSWDGKLRMVYTWTSLARRVQPRS